MIYGTIEVIQSIFVAVSNKVIFKLLKTIKQHKNKIDRLENIEIEI